MARSVVLPTNKQAVADNTDADGVRRQYVFPVPMIEVLAPTITPTPLPTVAPTSTPTLSPIPTSLPRPIYLPLALGEKCTPSERHVDVALVIDASTSMSELTAGGVTKAAAARQAALALLDQLHLGSANGDQASLISFNGAVKVAAGLTSDRVRLEVALSTIALAPQTRIHLGIEAAFGELNSLAHRATNQRVMVVLTDGRANPDPVSLAVEWARVAKAAGVTVFTVGLGEDKDAEALTEMASRPGYAYCAADGAVLVEICRRIGGTIPCPASAFWGGR